MSTITLGFVAIARPTFDTEFARQMAERTRAGLVEMGFNLVGTDALVMTLQEAEATAAHINTESPDLFIVFQASFADSTMTLKLADRVDAPLLIWAVPEERTGGRLRLNSLCGINLAAHALSRNNYVYEYVYGLPEDEHVIEKVKAVAYAAYAVRNLEVTRIGRLGENPEGFETCIPNTELLYNHLGVEIIQIDLEEFLETVQAQRESPEIFAEVIQKVQNQLPNFNELDKKATHGTLATYTVLRDLAKREELDGFAVRCWPEFFTELGCAACGAVSLLNSDMTPGSCEADVNGLITHLIMQWISSEPAFNADIVDFDLTENTAVLWHCGQAPLSMADSTNPVRGTIHSNRRLPLLMEFTLKPGRVTLARLSEMNGAFRLVIGTGEMLAKPPSFSGTSGVIRFDHPAKDILDTLINEGLEHHIALAYGNHVPALESLARQLDIPVLYL